MNGIYLRKSGNPLRKNSYAIFFTVDGKIVGSYTTKNGNIVDVGHVINNWINHDSIPVSAEMKKEGELLLNFKGV